jgi:hypothetical protein
MKFNFNKVDYEGDLVDFSDEELRELISEFETAQDSNVAEFERAAEATEEIDESIIEDFEDARETLITEIVEADAFDEVPMTEEKLAEEDFGELRDWQDFVAVSDPEGGEEGEGDGDDGGFNDFGTEAPVDNGEETDFADEALEGMQGLTL